jgi:hypothetical protein
LRRAETPMAETSAGTEDIGTRTPARTYWFIHLPPLP